MTRPAMLAALLACACVPRGAIEGGKDRDGDGYVAWELDGDDCDDSDASTNPGLAEVCGNDKDDDCDGNVDDDGTGASTWYPDGDGDGYGINAATTACRQPDGYLPNLDAGLDCDDGDDDANPSMVEICGNDIDDDCDGNTDDEGLGSPTWFPDLDQDGFATNDPVQACARPFHYLSALGLEDCDDLDYMVRPNAVETWYDGVDQDCDQGDDYDQDGDGFASAAEQIGGTDCRDLDSNVNPDAGEICFDTIDNDCDGHTDDTGLGAATWYPDLDQDTYATNDPVLACTQPVKHRSTLGEVDCNDLNSAVSPHASENWYDGIDQDCAGDDDYDRDHDGFRTQSILGGTDCQDGIFAVNPDADEICDNGLDDDCDTTANGCELLGTYAVADITASTISQTNSSLGSFGHHPFIADATGDGQPDVVAGGYAGSVWIFKSPIAPTITQTGSYGEFRSVASNSWSYADIGDFNGDGSPDIAIGRHEAQDARIYYGPLAGYFTQADADVVITHPTSGMQFGRSVVALPDFDADGHDELSIGAASPAISTPPAHYLFDGPYVNGWTTANRSGRQMGRLADDGTGFLATTTLLIPGGSRFLVTSNGGGSYTGTIASFSLSTLSGDQSILDNAIVLGIDAGQQEGFSIAAADFDGDGDTDIAIGAPGVGTAQGAVYVVSGSFSTSTPRLLSEATFTLLGTASNGQIGAQVAAFDFDGDGQMDLAMSGTTAADQIRIFYGPLTPGSYGPNDADVRISGVGYYQFGAGDLNSDGRDDLVLKTANTTLRVVLGHGR